MSSTFFSGLSAILGFTTIEEGVSEELIRNAQGRAQLAELERVVQVEQRENKEKIDAATKLVKSKQEGYAAEVRPFLNEFDSLFPAEHFYERSAQTVENGVHFVDNLLQQEGRRYGYVGKKLASVSLHVEHLKQEIWSGKPFHEALEGLLEDAEDEDLRIMARPLRTFDTKGTPSDLHVREAAFTLSQIIAKAGAATSTEKSYNRWLDVFRFHTTLSPSKEEENRLEARKHANEFMRYVRSNQYAKGLEVVQRVRKLIEERCDPVLKDFTEMDAIFRQQVEPIVASKMFLMYTSSWLDCARYACVEKVIS